MPDAGFHINAVGSNMTNLQQITGSKLNEPCLKNGGFKNTGRNWLFYDVGQWKVRAEHTPLPI